MFGRLGFFRRSREVERLNDALRAVGVDARTVTDAVKLTAVRLVKEASGARTADAEGCGRAAELLAYCILGPQSFGAVNDREQIASVETRLSHAVADGDSVDARLVLLTLHAGILHGDVVDRYQLTAD